LPERYVGEQRQCSAVWRHCQLRSRLPFSSLDSRLSLFCWYTLLAMWSTPVGCSQGLTSARRISLSQNLRSRVEHCERKRMETLRGAMLLFFTGIALCC